MKHKTTGNMEPRDIKELAWNEYGREAYQAEMRLRFMMETWPEEDGGHDGAESGNNTEKEVGL